jgi:2-polyprenyl-6-methoxyphenol hydroxylase-like FAD-dependent oxidoreductase
VTERHDVAIVGGGAVGLLLGCLLAERGLDVVVLERRASPSRSSRAIGIHPPGLAALDAAGVGEQVRAEGERIRGGIALAGGRVLARLRFDDPIHTLPQHRTEALLRERLAALAPGALQQGTEVTGIAPAAGGVALDTAGGRVEARWLVGADGIRSTVREHVGMGVREHRGAGPYAMADGPDGTGARGIALLHLEQDGIVESFPLPGGERRWVVRLREPAPTMTAERLQAILAERLPEPPRLPAGAPASAFVARQRVATSFARGPIALVGDAAHEVSPIGGQGMSLGWLDALELDRAIGAASGDDPFAGYALARRRAAVRATRRAAWNMSMGAPVPPAGRAARLALTRVLGLPPLRGALAAAFTMRGL